MEGNGRGGEKKNEGAGRNGRAYKKKRSDTNRAAKNYTSMVFYKNKNVKYAIDPHFNVHFNGW